MGNSKEIQWFPGHMAKALRQIREQLKLVDLVIEVLDARIPASSKNPDLDSITQGKLRLLALAKADLADPAMTKKWIRAYESSGYHVIAIDARKKQDIKALTKLIMKVAEEKKARDLARGIKNRPVRALVAGIPNVGKSTLINSLSNRSVAKTGNKPGVTKGQQWIKTSKGVELLDTPGILWPKFVSDEQGRHLAMIGTMPDSLELIPAARMAADIIRFCLGICPDRLAADYGIDQSDGEEEWLIKAAQSLHALKSGGEYDTDKAAGIIVDRFRKGNIGAVTLEEAPANE